MTVCTVPLLHGWVPEGFNVLIRVHQCYFPLCCSIVSTDYTLEKVKKRAYGRKHFFLLHISSAAIQQVIKRSCKEKTFMY